MIFLESLESSDDLLPDASVLARRAVEKLRERRRETITIPTGLVEALVFGVGELDAALREDEREGGGRSRVGEEGGVEVCRGRRGVGEGGVLG